MNKITRFNLIALAVSSAISAPVLADDAATDKAIEEVSVVGKKISYANNLVDASMIQQQAPITSVLAVMDNLPGISINEGDAFGGDDWSTSISMRGFSIDGSQQQLGMTIDGLPNGGSNYGGGSKANRYMDAENMATVEVAQGTSDIRSASLDALGGTFNFVSRDPAREQATTFAYSNGDHDASRYFIRHESGEIFTNTYAYASYSQTSNKRWIGEGANGGADRQHIEAKFVSELGALTLTGRISYDDVEEDNYNAVSVGEFEQNPDWDRLTWNWTGIPHFDQMYAEGWSTLRENTLAYLKFDYQLSADSALTFTPYFHKMKGRGDWIPPYLNLVFDANGNPTNKGGSNIRYGFTDQQGTPLAPAAGCTASFDWPWSSGPGLHPSCYPDDAIPVMSYRHTHYGKERMGATGSYELTLGSHDLLAGFWLENTDRDESRDWHKVIDARVYHHFDQTPYWTQFDNNFTTDTFKWYLQDTIALGDLTLNLGAQQYLVELEKFDRFANAVTKKVDSDSDVLLSAGAVYQINPELEIFAGYSENFAAIKDLVLENAGSNVDSLKPETAENIDFGLRYRADDLMLSATLYDIQFNDRITLIAPGAEVDGIVYDQGDGTYRNEGGIQSQGLELSATYRLDDKWSVYAAYTMNQSEYTDTIETVIEGVRNVEVVADTDVIDAVEDMITLSLDYYSGNLRGGISAKYTGERQGGYLDILNNPGLRNQVEDYTIIDINVGYTLEYSDNMIDSVDIAFVVNNLMDKRYLSSGTGNGFSYYIGGPRTAALTLTANF
ncbi:TonB-dependent receptor [Aliiglaciecola sp. CAU 1673]|uniref:TonB-dependent receptor domain-containing protein n=1 Tax=Aliiglaciecola sp. CAU 1673 TaxID=3032595 RepID=UPI0023DAD54B|nr:TonB-dependent receptor [Aliiglaciecola sp. CAU 1673]MDF2177793.1 TonB-dependent receptor [Aliiglaciecola sp. CAU 1673]